MRKVKLYRQHPLRIDTKEPAYVSCGVCCIMMALNTFRSIPATHRREHNLYADWRCHATPGVLGSAIAHVLAVHRLEVKLVHESPSLLENRDRNYPFDAKHAPAGETAFTPETHAKILAEHRSYIDRQDRSFTLETGAAITPERIREELAADRLVIIQRLIDDGEGGRVMHWMLIYGYENGAFLIRDPLQGSITMTDDELAGCIDTPFGASYIAVGDTGKA